MSFNIEKFIEDIKNYPELYSKFNKGYMDSKKKEEIWSDLSRKYNLNGNFIFLYEIR